VKKKAFLVMELEVGEDLVPFERLAPSQVEAAKAFFDAMSPPQTSPEAQEIWKLAQKFALGGPVIIRTPAGDSHMLLFGFALTGSTDPIEASKLKEMLARACILQSQIYKDKQGGGG